MMLRHAAARLALVAIVSQALGCAFHGDEIHIQTGDPKAAIYLDNEKIGMGGASAVVQRNQTHTIQVKEAGCEARTVQTGSKYDIYTVGPLWDAWATYPLVYTISPICPPAPEPPAEPKEK
jgi:hypothetical protein